METLNVATLPRATWIDIQRFDLVFLQPLLDFLRDKFRAIITADVLGDAVGSHDLPQVRQHLLGSDMALYADGHALAGILVQHRQHFQRTAFVGKTPRPSVSIPKNRGMFK